MSKNKCFWFNGKAGQVTYPAPLVFKRDALPWVETATHLSHELNQQWNMEYDAKRKRASYINKTTTFREMLEQKLSAILVYAGGMYGQRTVSAFKC